MGHFGGKGEEKAFSFSVCSHLCGRDCPCTHSSAAHVGPFLGFPSRRKLHSPALQPQDACALLSPPLSSPFLSAAWLPAHCSLGDRSRKQMSTVQEQGEGPLPCRLQAALTQAAYSCLLHTPREMLPRAQCLENCCQGHSGVTVTAPNTLKYYKRKSVKIRCCGLWRWPSLEDLLLPCNS